MRPPRLLAANSRGATLRCPRRHTLPPRKGRLEAEPVCELGWTAMQATTFPGTVRAASWLAATTFALPAVAADAQSAAQRYRERSDALQSADFDQRRVPAIPEPGQQLRVIIDTDAANEIDDQWALALALLSPERFHIEGIVAANFDNEHGGLSSIDQSFDEIQRVLQKAGMAGRFPVLHGSPPMRYKYEPSESEGVDFIIEKAMASSATDRLWLISLGAATDLASAYLSEPRIAERAVFFWHGRTRWPEKCWNFNVFGDRHAAMLLFSAPIPFVLFDTGTDLTCPMEESELQVRPFGELGAYLHEFRRTNPWFMQPDKGFFDLGDIAALLDPTVAQWQVESCPEVAPDLSYRFTGKKGKILRCYAIDRDRTFALLYDRLQSAYPREAE
jgi:inosine-uridine nucleoside N-ribohydrolase